MHGPRVAQLLPYALASVAVVVTSAIALVATVRPLGAGPAPVPTAAPAAVRGTLSETGRLAYWRTGANSGLELWVSDLDGGRRWTVATASAGSDVALTRWSPDGSAVGYAISGVTLGIARLDGTSTWIDIPTALRADHWKIVSFEWSPDASRVAASLRAGNGLSDQSDVYVVDARAGATWQRATTLGDAFAGRWISSTQLFIETASGLVAVLDVARGALRPLTGMPITSALIGRDGRVYFVGGRFARGDISTQPFASGWVWSTTFEGDDLRRETKAPVDQMRLYGMLADGRAAVGVPGGVYFSGDESVVLSFQAGTVRKLAVSEDGRRVIGITEQRVLLVDPTKVLRPASGGLPASDAASVLLAGIRDADVWFPHKAALAHTSGPAAGGPPARLAFVLGRSLWEGQPDGTVRSVFTEPTFYISPPRWSPSGDRLAAITTSGSPARASLVVIGASGTKRWDLPALSSFLQWSPDGSSIAVSNAPGPTFNEWTTQSYDATTGAAKDRIAGRATWTAAGLAVLGDGDLAGSASAARVRQRVDLIDGAARRTITDARRIAAAPLLRDAPDAALEPAISEVVPSGDPAYLGVWLRRVNPSGITAAGSFVVVRVSDGLPVWVLPANDRVPGFVGNVSLSPSARLAAWNFTDRSDPPVSQTFVADPASGRLVLQFDGSFGGWSPDGAWVYLARSAGLFAYPLSGGDGVRVSAIGVPVVAAPAR